MDPTEVALRALRHRDRSRRELEQRLAQAGIPADERFATGRARTLAERGAGNDLIRTDLRRRGVAAEAVEEAITELEPEDVRAAELYERRGADAKALRYLARKGFSQDVLTGISGLHPVD